MAFPRWVSSLEIQSPTALYTSRWSLVHGLDAPFVGRKEELGALAWRLVEAYAQGINGPREAMAPAGLLRPT
jgi:hypothetical protein